MCSVDLVSKNLPKVQTLIWKAREKWFNLGLELGVDEVSLKVLKQQHDVDTCFREMLSSWLKMIDPLPTWEGLLAALKAPPVGHSRLAKQVGIQQGIPEPPEESLGSEDALVTVACSNTAS